MFGLLIKLLATLYALFILVGGLLAADDSAALGYPLLIVILTSLANIALALGIVVLAFRWYPAWVLKHWKYVFLGCVVDLILGLAMDAYIPGDYNLVSDGLVWLKNTIMIVLVLCPAFYLNFRLAYYRHD